MSPFQKNSFQELFERSNKKVFNIALNIVQNIEDAEDITQEVFLEVFKSFDKFNEKSEVSTWIYRIAVNKSLDFLKAKKRKKRFAVLTHLFQPETGIQLHEASHFEHPGVMLENKERARILYEAVGQLPGNQQTAFVLVRIEGFSLKETAEITGVTEKAIESLLQRAKDNLKKILGNIYNQQRI